jgi:hypothetical protein
MRGLGNRQVHRPPLQGNGGQDDAIRQGLDRTRGIPDSP